MKKETNFVYHGSQIRGLKLLIPKESGYGKRFVYATDEFVLAVIFINRRPGGSLVASWGIEKGRPYFCERVRGIFYEWYAERKGSIYVLSKRDFYHESYMEGFEWVSEKPVEVLDEIKVDDVKEFLLELADKGKINLYFYDDRPERFRGDDDLVELAIKMIEKYGKERVIKRVREFQPQIEKRVIERLRNGP